MKKKALAIALSVMTLFSLCACGNKVSKKDKEELRSALQDMADSSWGGDDKEYGGFVYSIGEYKDGICLTVWHADIYTVREMKLLMSENSYSGEWTNYWVKNSKILAKMLEEDLRKILPNNQCTFYFRLVSKDDRNVDFLIIKNGEEIVYDYFENNHR